MTLNDRFAVFNKFVNKGPEFNRAFIWCHLWCQQVLPVNHYPGDNFFLTCIYLYKVQTV